jgi:hypothetical protein
VLSNIVLYYAVNILNARKLVFFYNLHYSGRMLWTIAFSIDTLILITLLAIIRVLP